MGNLLDRRPLDGGVESFRFIQMFGVKINLITEFELHPFLSEIIDNGGKSLVLNVNVNAMNLAYRLEWFRSFLNQADIVFCDGAGVIFGARILGYRIPQRITYADWLWHLVEYSIPHNYTFFFLGAKPGITNQAARQIQLRYPEIRIVGTHHGYFNHEQNCDENQKVIKEINNVCPNFLILGFGMPLQEQWLMDNWGNLKVNVALTGGAVFDYISGNLRRPPKWLNNHGLEWMGRLIIEPKRLWKRYLLGNPLFIWRILKCKWLREEFS